MNRSLLSALAGDDEIETLLADVAQVASMVHVNERYGAAWYDEA